MAVIMEFEVSPMTPDQYDAVDGAIDPGSNPPEGMIAHSARFDGDTLRVLDIWESEQAFQNFVESRLGPAMGEALGDDAPPPPEPKFTQLHNTHVGSSS